MHRRSRVYKKLSKKAKDLAHEMDRLYREGDKRAASEMYVRVSNLEKEIVDVLRFPDNEWVRNTHAMEEHLLREKEIAEAKEQKKPENRHRKQMAQKIACRYNENI